MGEIRPHRADPGALDGRINPYPIRFVLLY
jgi:hypothetical protein